MTLTSCDILTAAIPAWFDGAVNQAINGPINEIHDNLHRIEDDITDIKAVLVSMKRMDAKVSFILLSYANADSFN